MPTTLELLEKTPESLREVGIRAEEPCHNSGRPWLRVGDQDARTGPGARHGPALPVVRPAFHTSYDRRIDSEVLLHGTQATVLDRGASLDDAGDRGGSTLGRLPKGVSHERARCLRGILVVEIPPDG
jgi:hypothetical protein